VLKVTGVKVTPLAFGNSDLVKVGQRVIAVGNPFGFDETVTQGIISAKGRSMEDSATDFFQTDAAINPGNSGGPLVDLRGEIIGINSSIYADSDSGGWQGLGFAIPSNTVRRAMEAIIKNGRVPHGYLGVEVLSPEMAQQMGMADIDGAYVKGVTPGSPAEKAGIRQGDIITSLGDHAVHDFTGLRTQIAGVETGTQVPVGVQRGNQAVTLMVQIVEQTPDAPGHLPEQKAEPIEPAASPTPGADAGLLAGVHVTEIPPDHAEDLPPHAHGVMVTGVDDDSLAAGSLQQSDVIEEIDHLPIHSVPEYEQAASEVTGQQVLLSICRGRERSFTVVTAR
jgi:serine protease Do